MKLRIRLLLVLLLGLGLGLGYAWLIEPVAFTESSPAQVVASYRHTWLIMAAEAYAQDGDWDRTRARLDALHDPYLNQTVVELFDRYSTHDSNPLTKALAKLADRLGARTAAMNVYLATPIVTHTSVPTPTPAPRVTITLHPTVRASSTPNPIAPTAIPTFVSTSPYQLISRVAECTRPPAAPQIRIIIRGANGQGLPGKDVWITWEGGADRLVTGLKPEIDAGYGDFDMTPDRSYNVSIDKPTAVIITGLRAEPCTGDGRLSWRLIFR